MRWERTLKQLPIRYRKPYTARHTSVSWNLMLDRNPMLVAKEHGHRVLTMLTLYAAWVEGAVETDIISIRATMGTRDQTVGHAGVHECSHPLETRSIKLRSLANESIDPFGMDASSPFRT